MKPVILLPRPASESQTHRALWATPFGTMELRGSKNALHESRFINDIRADQEALPDPWYDAALPLNLAVHGTEFQCQVWQALLSVESGLTLSYRALAERIQHPTATRAVANAVAANPLPGIIPCHRVIRLNGQLGGYSQELWRKAALLNAESKGSTLYAIC
ncbi:MAG: methylated-DNA--[protein]-cysteine S-methyltransferase [Gammaproteobacteria bacterium]|nr:methylated-DNA--[protein]-cysteine S-methyltransferase [Gammaproteobacteria bacterium]